MSDAAATAGSFRDPSGFVFQRNGVLFRQISARFREHFDHLMDSGLYRELVGSGLLVPHEEVETTISASSDAYKVLRPEPIPFISYPYEWCFGQLKDAALATLRIQRIALDFGMSLRDASAYNIQFRDGKPVLIDTLSFEKLRAGEPWVAYRQFCQHFLAPLALMTYRDLRLLQLLRVHVDGIPLDLATSLLPGRARRRLSLSVHLFSHARSQRRHAGGAAASRPRRRKFTIRAFLGLLDSLGTGVRKLNWDPGQSSWVGYYAERESYSPQADGHKQELVTKFLEEAAPEVVWDLGANTGRFSRLAGDRGMRTVSFDSDPACVEASYQQAIAAGERNILPLVLDLTNPSPGLGWAHRERMSLADRGPADLVMALALIHHLAIANNVPLGMVAAFLGNLCTWLMVEFVPKSDPKVGELLAAREDVFPDYTMDGFEQAFGGRFSTVRRERIQGSERVLYLMRAIP